LKYISPVWIEVNETFPKQTLRNRYFILGPNGQQMLTVPLDDRKNHAFTKDIRVSQSNDWKRKHKRAIDTAYSNAPFYEYYKDDFLKMFFDDYELLIDLQMACTNHFMKTFRILKNIHTTQAFEKVVIDGKLDLRQHFDQKNPAGLFIDHNYSYIQVFAEKFGFVSNLSIIDMLFNCGPDTATML
ncbi:MAG: WbqC family protein, partial [Bacteroidetes bacterium]|nr:WbqC family protein [Bacteroidota bacterium]